MINIYCIISADYKVKKYKEVGMKLATYKGKSS